MPDIVHVKALTELPDPPAPEGLAPIHHGKFTFTGQGLIVTGAPTYEEWEEVGAVLAVMDRGIQFLVGDWISYGQEKYGELAAQAIDARSWRPETVRAYVWLAKSVPPANRMLDRGLSIKHHLAVAALPPSEQRLWLRRALNEVDPWTVSRLTTAIKHGEDQQPTGWLVLVRCHNAADQETLIKDMELSGRSAKAIVKRGV